MNKDIGENPIPLPIIGAKLWRNHCEIINDPLWLAWTRKGIIMFNGI